MRGQIRPDHIALNQYQLIVVGLPPLTIVTISGIEEELEAVELPDRTMASGGHTGTVELTIGIPMHHLVEQAAMEVWWRQAQDPVSPVYKLPATLIHQSISGNAFRSFTLLGVFVKGRNLPDLELVNEGEMAVVEWVLNADQILLI